MARRDEEPRIISRNLAGFKIKFTPKRKDKNNSKLQWRQKIVVPCALFSVPVYVALWVQFYLINPFVFDAFGVGWFINQFPGFILFEGLQLLVQSFTPFFPILHRVFQWNSFIVEGEKYGTMTVCHQLQMDATRLLVMRLHYFSSLMDISSSNQGVRDKQIAMTVGCSCWRLPNICHAKLHSFFTRLMLTISAYK